MIYNFLFIENILKMKAQFLVSLAVALSGFLFVFLVESCGRKVESNAPKAFELTAALKSNAAIQTVENLPVVDEVKLTGKVIPDENNLVKIYPVMGGKVVSVDAEIGDLVTTKKTLAVINSSEARTYQKELLNAKNEVEIARKNLSVQEELFKTKFSSEKELLLAKKELELTKNELARAEETYKVFSMSKGGDYVVKSPVAGFILEKNIGPELQIRSDMSDYIFSVARLDEVYVALNIYENDIEKIRVGQTVKIQVLSYPDKIFSGKITKIQNIIDPVTKTIQARVLMQNKDFELKPEMNCTGYVEFKENGKMIAVPKSAVIFDANKNFVMVYHTAKKIEPREVIIHKESSDKIYIQSGLKAGEKILTKNVLFIYDAVTE